MAILAYYIRDWRYLAGVLALPTAVGFFLPLFMDESARWLISQNRIKEADDVLYKIARANKKVNILLSYLAQFIRNFNFIFITLIKSFRGLQANGLKAGDLDDQGPQAGVSDLFKTPRVRARTFNLFYQVYSLFNLSILSGLLLI